MTMMLMTMMRVTMTAMLMMVFVILVLMNGGGNSNDCGSDVGDDKASTPGPNTFTSHYSLG